MHEPEQLWTLTQMRVVEDLRRDMRANLSIAGSGRIAPSLRQEQEAEKPTAPNQCSDQQTPVQKSAVKNGLGILFLHHQTDPVTMNNLASIRRQNPRALIVTISAGKTIDGGYALNATPRIKTFHSINPPRSSDWLVCSWFVQRKESCEKWWIIEWDTFCNIPVEDYYRPVWHFPFVATNVIYPNREPLWHWFNHAMEIIPEEYTPHVRGTAPFLFLISDEALSAICKTLLENPILHGNGEFRFGTAAAKCGYPPCAYSPPNDRITWVTWKGPVTEKAVFHPVKRLHEIG